MIVFGVVLMVTTPVYSWYALMLLALVALSGRVEWLPMVLGAGLSMVGALLVTDGVAVHRIVYSIAAAATGVLLLATAWRTRRAAVNRSPSTASPSATSPTGSPSTASLSSRHGQA